MVLYRCLRCGFESSYKNNFRKHIYRKYTCKPIKNKISIEEVRRCFKNNSLDLLEDTINKNELIESKQYICPNCDKKFTLYKNLWRHQKNNCKSNSTEIDNLKQEINDLKIQIKGNVYANNNINSNNIIINNFGSENMNYITEKVMKRLLKQGTKSIPKLIKHIHFNPNHPENHNVRINNKKLKFAEIRENNKWKYKHKKAVLDDLVDFGYVTLEEFKSNNESELDDLLRKGFNRLMKKYEEEKNEIVDDVELEVLNGMKDIEI